MATQTKLKQTSKQVLLRMAASERDKLWKLLFSRYPDEEWGSFIKLGFRETNDGLVLTVKEIIEPAADDLKKTSKIVEINPSYIRRYLNVIKGSSFASGIAHSHPADYVTCPSELDDDMESYLSGLFKLYTSDSPFVSLIFSRSGKILSGSGRIYWRNKVFYITRFAIEGTETALYNFELPIPLKGSEMRRIKRLVSTFSKEAGYSLARGTIGIVGASGTGSPVIELLARAGLGNIIIVDHDVFDDSNLERLHGSEGIDLGTKISKVLLAKRHILSINPKCDVTVIKGRIPQQEVVEKLLWADIVLGCTDSQAARVALTDLSLRYLVPVIDVGVSMEGEDGNVTGQVIQFNRLFPDDPCVYCRKLIDGRIVTQELMSEVEKKRLQVEAKKAKKIDNNGGGYWIDMPQINTVGYLTTTAGGLLAGYAIGYLTGRFSMYGNLIELSITTKGISIAQTSKLHDSTCQCQGNRGVATQKPLGVLITAPAHWEDAQIL